MSAKPCFHPDICVYVHTYVCPEEDPNPVMKLVLENYPFLCTYVCIFVWYVRTSYHKSPFAQPKWPLTQQLSVGDSISVCMCGCYLCARPRKALHLTSQIRLLCLLPSLPVGRGSG